MEFTIERDVLLKSLGHTNGIVEKKNNTTNFIKHFN